MRAYSPRPVEDLTARARIVDAALVQFAARGSVGTTMRGIAEAAGVSVGLVQHHFGTKDSLRAACDERVLTLVRAKFADAERLTSPDVLASLYDEATPVMSYVARAALETDERAAAIFDEIASLTAAWFTDQWPDRFPPDSDRTRDAAAAMVAMNLSTLVLHHQLARFMGMDPGATVPSPRVGLATIDVYRAMGEFLATPYGLRLREAVDAYHDPTGKDRP